MQADSNPLESNFGPDSAIFTPSGTTKGSGDDTENSPILQPKTNFEAQNQKATEKNMTNIVSDRVDAMFETLFASKDDSAEDFSKDMQNLFMETGNTQIQAKQKLEETKTQLIESFEVEYPPEKIARPTKKIQSDVENIIDKWVGDLSTEGF